MEGLDEVALLDQFGGDVVQLGDADCGRFADILEWRREGYHYPATIIWVSHGNKYQNE